jgi:hypothetical protein
MRIYIERGTMRALTPTGGFLRGFAYSLNPYSDEGSAPGDVCPFRASAASGTRARRLVGAFVLQCPACVTLVVRNLPDVQS